MTSVGFRMTDVRYMDIAGILPWYLVFVLMKRKISGGKVSLYDKLIIPPMRLIEKLLPIPIGKNLSWLPKNKRIQILHPSSQLIG